MTDNVIERLGLALEDRYRIQRELGEGGMATVYLAQDLRHDRKVALKVLKPELAAVVGAERFLAEIKTTANLQHPHILPLFDSGEADGFLFYVMPYVEGESLREKLDREKQLSVDEAVEIAEKVAGALEYAHEQGIVHRDIKPANILMSRGEPLVADFGIALALSEAGGGRITETGLSLGTPHYMSPEQASGDQSLDKRSDVYALGCVLYEMLTGEPPYGGPTAQSVLAKILTGDAQRITALRRTVPAHVDAAVAKALEKLPADRFASADAFIRALANEGFRHTARQGVAPAGGQGVRTSWLPAAGMAVAALAAGLVLGLLLRKDGPPQRVFRAAVEFPEGQSLLEPPFGPALALSSDGETLVYAGVAEAAGGWQLWVRRAGVLQATPIPGTVGVFTPTLSPDGDAVAFADGDGALTVVGLNSGTTRTLAEGVNFIADWAEDGRIYYADATTRFYRVPAGGGEPEPIPGLALPEEVPVGATLTWTWGDVLPDATHGVWTRFPISGDLNELTIGVIDFATGEFNELSRGTAPRYLNTGHLVWADRDGVLRAAPFDPGTGEITGPIVPVAEDVRTDAAGSVNAAFSDNGDLVYRQGGSFNGGMRPVWYDRSGDSTYLDADWQVLPAAAGNWSGLALSPSGDRVVTTDGTGGGSQLWVKDLEDDTPPYRITFEGNFHVRPRWGPDGEMVTFISNLAGDDHPTQVWAKAADGSGVARPIFTADVEIEEAVISPDGEWLVYRQGGTTVGRDIYGVRLGQDSVAQPLVATDADEKSPQISPDGRWLAYMSDETGQTEIFVRPFPDVTGGRWQISRGGGGSPLWSHSGTEIFYLGVDGRLSLIAAQLELRDSSLSVRSRETLFPITDQYTDQNYTALDVSNDDQRFLMYSFGRDTGGSLVWVRNWVADWQSRVGEGR